MNIINSTIQRLQRLKQVAEVNSGSKIEADIEILSAQPKPNNQRSIDPTMKDLTAANFIDSIPIVTKEVTTTLLNLPTISVVAEPIEVEEKSQLLWNFSLTEPVGEGGLTVALDLVEDTDPLPGDITYFVEGSENIASSSNSSSVEIINPGFEEPTLEDGEFTLTSEDTEIPGWTLYNRDSLDVDLALADAGAWNPAEEQYPNGIPGGNNVGYTFVDSSLLGTGEIGLQQTTEELLAADTEYTLTVDIANATGGDEFGDYSGFPGYRIELLAGQEVIAVDDNSLSIEEGLFGTSTVTYNATEDDSFLDRNLGIRLMNLNADSGLEVDFDNVSLTAM